jgi:D-glycero-alpha-D-manno-heptose 1-phosphate guanylyltransferase
MQAMLAYHTSKNAVTTLALKHMQEFERYGVVRTEDAGCITAFEEKKYYSEGLINGGVYIVNKAALAAKHLPEKYSFEKDYFEAFVHEGNMYGFVSNGYFIDIGIPADYEKAQEDFKTVL